MARKSDIKRTLKRVDVPHADEAARRNLRRTFTGLRDILTRLPEERLVEMVADQAKELMRQGMRRAKFLINDDALA